MRFAVKSPVTLDELFIFLDLQPLSVKIRSVVSTTYCRVLLKLNEDILLSTLQIVLITYELIFLFNCLALPCSGESSTITRITKSIVLFILEHSV